MAPLVDRKKYWFFLSLSVMIVSPVIRDHLTPFYKKKKVRSQGKTAIVTGATGNIGFSLCYSLAKRKVRLIMACRDMELCKIRRRELILRTGFSKISCQHLDLEDITSINQFADDVIKKQPRVDILINNAAVKDVKQKTITKDGIELNYMVNFLGPYLLTIRLFDKIKETSEMTLDGRIINFIGNPTNSWPLDLDDINFDKRRYNAKDAYRQSKLALAYFSILLDKYSMTQAPQVYVYGIDPIFSRFKSSLGVVDGFVQTYANLIMAYVRACPTRISHIAVYCALDDEIRDRKSSGKLYSYLHDYWKWKIDETNLILANKIWHDAAERLTGIDIDETTKLPVVNDISSLKEDTKSGKVKPTATK